MDLGFPAWDRGTQLALPPLNQMEMGIAMSKREGGTGNMKTREEETHKNQCRKQEDWEADLGQRQRRSLLPSPKQGSQPQRKWNKRKGGIPSSTYDVHKIHQGSYQSHPSHGSNHDTDNGTSWEVRGAFWCQFICCRKKREEWMNEGDIILQWERLWEITQYEIVSTCSFKV